MVTDGGNALTSAQTKMVAMVTHKATAPATPAAPPRVGTQPPDYINLPPGSAKGTPSVAAQASRSPLTSNEQAALTADGLSSGSSATVLKGALYTAQQLFPDAAEAPSGIQAEEKAIENILSASSAKATPNGPS